MDETLLKIGLPVKCRICKAKGNVRPMSDYGGWYKYKPIRKPLVWYCPKDADKIRAYRQGILDRYATPAPIVKANVEEELYKLLD